MIRTTAPCRITVALIAKVNQATLWILIRHSVPWFLAVLGRRAFSCQLCNSHCNLSLRLEFGWSLPSYPPVASEGNSRICDLHGNLRSEQPRLRSKACYQDAGTTKAGPEFHAQARFANPFDPSDNAPGGMHEQIYGSADEGDSLVCHGKSLLCMVEQNLPWTTGSTVKSLRRYCLPVPDIRPRASYGRADCPAASVGHVTLEWHLWHRCRWRGNPPCAVPRRYPIHGVAMIQAITGKPCESVRNGSFSLSCNCFLARQENQP